MKIQSLFFALSLIYCSCSSTREVIEPTSPPETEEHLGIITTQYAEFGCRYVIEMQEENAPAFLNPVNLSEEFQVNDLHVRFRFRLADEHGACDMALPVFIEKMEKLSP